MSFPRVDTMSFDMEWDIFCKATGWFYPVKKVTSPKAPTTSVDNRHNFARGAVKPRSHPCKGGSRKNRKGKEWHDIGRIMKARKEVGKESIVYLNGRLIDPFKLQKNISRPMLVKPFEKYGNTPLPAVPRDFAVRSPQMEGGPPTGTQELPFMHFRSLFRPDATSHIYPSENPSSSSDSALHETVSTMHCQIIIPKLEALLPGPMFYGYTAGSSEATLTVERASGVYFDLLSFSMTNNFAGLDGLPPQHILDYLKSQSSTHISRFVQSIGGETGRALAEKLFVCAIEAEDTSIVDIILRHSQNTKIDANKHVCKYEGVRYTPIERSAGLRDIETTRVLLKYGADPNKTFVKDKTLAPGPRGWREGALACVLDWNIQEKTPVEFGLLQLLLEHGAHVKTRHVRVALLQQSAEVLCALFQAGAWENHEEWENSGLFGAVIRVLDDEAATAFINMLKQIGADINAPLNRDYPTMLDVAAKRGNLDMVLTLLHFGAIETETTLSYAIQSENRAVVDLFINGGKADSVSCCTSRTTPYAEAIRIKDASLMQALEQRGALDNIKEGHRFRAALNAASEARNLDVIRLLLDTGMGGRCKFVDALQTATKANDEEMAIMLCHGGIHDTRALEQAMRNQNPRIVRAFLNSNACYSFPETLRESRALMLAARWGDISVIEDLLIAGYDINQLVPGYDTPLMVAITKQNQPLVRFLVNAGAEVNETVREGTNESSTALSTAIGIQEIDTVNYLLSVGADPGDPAALLKSCEYGGEALRLLLEAFLKKYPNGKRGYYDDALAQAVVKNDISTLEGLSPAVALKFPGYSQHAGELIGTRLIASNEVSLRAVGMLLDLGANPDAVVWSEERTERLPLLSVAIKARNFQMVQLLLDKGADVNFPATRGIKFTPMQAAAQTGCYELVLKLINQGADADAPAAEMGGGTAVQLAAIGGFVGIVELLLTKGAEINRAPSIVHGRTALEGAAEHGRLDMVQFLLHSGARIDGPSRKSFLNAMKLAEENGHFVVLELLQSYSL